MEAVYSCDMQSVGGQSPRKLYMALCGTLVKIQK